MIVNHARPIEDTEVVAWVPSSGVTLYDKINEEVPNDTGFINSTAAANRSTFRISPLQRKTADALSATFRCKSPAGGYLSALLLSGASVIAERLLGYIKSDSYVMLRLDLTSLEVAAIADYGNLAVTLIAESTVSALLLEDGATALGLDGVVGRLLMERNS